MKACRCNGDVRLSRTMRSSLASWAVAHAPTLPAKAAGVLRRSNGLQKRNWAQSLGPARNLIAAYPIMREPDTLGVSVMTRPVVRALPRDIAGAKRRGIATHRGPTLVKGMKAAIVRIGVVPGAPFRSFGRRPIRHNGQCDCGHCDQRSHISASPSGS